MQRRGFTLLELLVVIIILGVLSTLGLMQYTRIIEKSRGAEPKAILGSLRQMATAYRLENNNVTGISDAQLSLGSSAGDIPTLCAGQESHFFQYNATCAEPTCTFKATRCSTGGKKPEGGTVYGGKVLNLTSNFTSGSDLWGGDGGY